MTYQNINSLPIPASTIVTVRRSNETGGMMPVLPIPGQKDAHFKSACLLAHLIDLTLESGRVHYRTKAGQLLTTLDEVIVAILNDNLEV